MAVMRSEHKLRVSIDFLECSRGAFVKDTLGFQALVFVEIIGRHTSSKRLHVSGAELGKNSLSWTFLIFSWEAML